MRTVVSRALVLLGALLAALAFTQCQDPTQATVVIRTNVPCNRVVATAVVAGPANASLEHAPAVGVATSCIDGTVGSIAIVPASSDDRGARIGVRVVMALDTNIDACTIDRAYAGCIVARRVLHFIPHVSVVVPINMYLTCKGVPCDSVSTCSIAGQCVSDELDTGACGESECFLPGETALGSGGGSSGNASSSGTPGTPGSSGDASRDSSSGDGGVHGNNTGRVVCNSTMAALCAVGEVCCTSFSPYQCVLPSSCEGARYECDDPSDCGAGRCCEYQPSTGAPFSNCQTACTPPTSGVQNFLCRTTADCPGSMPYCFFSGGYGRCRVAAPSTPGVQCPDSAQGGQCPPNARCCLQHDDQFPRGFCKIGGVGCPAEVEAFTCDGNEDCGGIDHCIYRPGLGASCSGLSAGDRDLCETPTSCAGGAPCAVGGVDGLYGLCL